jgi:hypothetical protein
MTTRSIRAASRLVVAAMLSACGGSTVGEPTDEDLSKLTFTVVSPATFRVSDAFSVLQDTVVIAVRTAGGNPVPPGFLISGSATGYLKELGSNRWFRRGRLSADSSGMLRFIWQVSGSPVQRLAIQDLVVSLPLPRPAPVLIADSVVTSGPAAVCIQQAGRVGCLDDGPPDSAATRAAPGRINWFTLDAPVRNIGSTASGACALLNDGRTTCWEDRGPDRSAVSSTDHPPLVELRGAVGRTAAGTVWFRFRRTGYPAGWLRVPTDSVITTLLENYNENVVCGRTASDVVMCGRTYQSSLSPGFRADTMQVARDSLTSTVLRANGGYAAQLFFAPSSIDQLILSRATGGATGATRFSAASSTTRWSSFDPADSLLSGPDAGVRACVRELDAVCDASRPWRSVSRAGTLVTSHISYESGYQRTCGIREFVVCASRDATGRLNYAGTYQVLAASLVDTVRLAP